ncbi:MAG: murein biosynthesis integral membrane protein MurJ, partial [Candidatus Omnitrophica bacterium]|nr:murein biosynthesis integral membrane protein MurJ [Candidatus Omnitrophota bacterium]
VNLIAPGFQHDLEKLNTTTMLTRFFFPYLMLVSLSAYSMGILNSFGHFLFPALSPCLLNLSLITSLLIFKENVKGLILGVWIGGVLQFLIQLPMLYKKGFRLGWPRKLFHPGAKLILKLMIPRLFNSGIYYLNNFVDTIFGSLSKIVGEGGVAGLYFSYRLILFPLGIFSTALFQASLPVFSLQVLQPEYQNLKQTLLFSLRGIFFVILPISIYFMFFSREIIGLIFRSGKFDAYAVEICSEVLFFYSIGLFAYGANKILQGCFFSLKDTLTPTKVSFLALTSNIILNSILIFPFKIKGVAFATSISGIISFFCLLFVLDKRLGRLDLRELRESFLRIFLASIFSALCVRYLLRFFTFSYQSFFTRLFGLLILGSLLLFSFLLSCLLFKVKELKEFSLWIFKR